MAENEATAWQFQRQCKCSLQCRANALAWPAYGAAGSLSDTQHMGRHLVWASKRWLSRRLQPAQATCQACLIPVCRCS